MPNETSAAARIENGLRHWPFLGEFLMKDLDSGGTAARANGAPIADETASGMAVIRRAVAASPRLLLHPSIDWLRSVVDLQPGTVHVLRGDLAAAQRLALQIALNGGRAGTRTLAFALSGGVAGLIQRARTMNAAWPATEATDAAANVAGFDGADSLRDIAYLIDAAVDARSGTHREVGLVIFDYITAAARPVRGFSRLADLFGRCVSPCRQSGRSVLALVAGNDETALTLASEANAEWSLERRGNRYELTVRHVGGSTGQSILLESDPVTGEFRPAVSVEPFPARARAWVGGDASLVDLEAILRLAEERRPRSIGHGLPDRRVDLALSLLERVPFIDLKRSDWDAEVLLVGDGPFASAMGLALAVALAASLLRKPLGNDYLFCGEVGLDRRIKPLSATAVESLTFAVASGQLLPPNTKLLVTPRTAKLLDGIACDVIPTPTLDSALLHLWPDLH